MGRRAGGPCPARGSPAPKSSRQAALLAASILSSCFLLTQAQDIIPVTLEPPKQIKGQDVTLIPGGTPDFVSCNWYREAAAETSQILTYFPPPNPVQQNFTNFTGRETAGPGCTLHIRNLALNDTGDYIVTKIARTRSERGQAHIEVLDGGSPDTGLSPGQIVGIVIGCLLGAVLIVALIYFVLKNTTCGMTAQHSSNGNIPSAPGRNQGVTDTKPTAGEEDIQYTTVAFNSHSPHPQGSGPTSPSESGTIYSVIKAK